MIEITTYLEGRVDVVGLVTDLLELPEPIKPVYFAEDEGKIIKKNKIVNQSAFNDFIRNNPNGFFLYSKNNICINISLRKNNLSEVAVWLEPTPLLDEFVMIFFKTLSKHKPIFGFACDLREHYHRNRHYISIDNQHIESWAGRDLGQYIPGIYWQTLFSEKLMNRHQVSLSDLSNEAISTEISNGRSLYIFKYYEKVEKWEENVQRLDEFCEKTEGIFSIRSVEAATEKISTILQYFEILDEWK